MNEIKKTKTVTYNLGTEQHRIDTHWNGQIILIGDDSAVRHNVLHIIGRAGGRIANPMSTDFRLSDIEKRVNAIAVILHISNWNASTRKSLFSIEKYCSQYDLPVLILLPFGLLNSVIDAIEYSNTEFLFTDGDDNFAAELLVTLNGKIVETTSATFSNRDEPNLTDLKKISADVERIARVLARLSDQQQDRLDRNPIGNPVLSRTPASSVSDDPFDFKAQDGSSIVPFGNALEKYQAADMVSAEQIRNLIKARRLRAHYFDAALFADPAWDMLLDLMAARLENTMVSVSSLCIAANVPPTTALRWIRTMTEEKIFERKADDADGRRIFVQLNDQSAAAMIGFLSMIRRDHLMIV